METAILVRHGESEFSARSLVNGDVCVACPLTASGVAQARALGAELAGEPIDLCVTSEFERTRATAELILAGRGVPTIVVPELNDPRAGRFEGGPLDEYRAWAHAYDSRAEPPGGGESRIAIARRYAAGLRRIAERPEPVILVVIHALPIAYVLMALDGHDPAARIDVAVEYATPYRVEADDLERAAARIGAWADAPTW